MAYQAKARDPLFDSETQAALERRARELLGRGLIGAGLVIAMMHLHAPLLERQQYIMLSRRWYSNAF